MDALAVAVAALRQCAADASVPLSRLPDADQSNGWRDVAVQRIETARAALAQIEALEGELM